MDARKKDARESTAQAWMRFRFGVVGPLLSAPPGKGQLGKEISALAQRKWSHPVTGKPVTFAPSTIERWYYSAIRSDRDPVGALRPRPRKDLGRSRAFSPGLVTELIRQYRLYPSWSYRLHADNLRVRVGQDRTLGPMPSYSTVVRFMKARGLVKKPRRRRRFGAGAPEIARFESRETRSFEAEYTHSLWHLDFHHGSKKILVSTGEWATPIALCILDDHSRLVCHVQWYLDETTESLIHGLSQAILKRGLPRALLTDNGSAMVAEETEEGLLGLGVSHFTTVPYTPQQNGKQEVFWASLEGRLMAMVERKKDLTLRFLNDATQAWTELDYNRRTHEEIHTNTTPLDRFLHSPDVSRPSPSPEDLRLAFRMQTKRTQRKSDGTIRLEGSRFEIPARYRHLDRVTLRYARWDLGCVHLVDFRSGKLLSPIFPVDKTANAEGWRKRIEEPTEEEKSGGGEAATGDEVAASDEVAPLLLQLMQEYSATGLPPAYLATRDKGKDGSDSGSDPEVNR